MNNIWLKAARNAALLLLASIGAYLFSSIATSWIAFRVARTVQHLNNPWLHLLLGVVLLDLSKLVGLLPAAWIVRRAVTLRPWLTAAILVILCFTLELAVMAIIGQAGWVLQKPALIVTRSAVGALMVWPVQHVLARARVKV